MHQRSDDITIRLARPEDEPLLRRLAALDSARFAGGEHLLALQTDEPLAAIPLSLGGVVIADPFRPTAEARALLELRARQLRHARGHTRRRPALARMLRRLLAAR